MFTFEDTIKRNVVGKYKQARRGPIYVGFQCHQRCGFCYYKSRCHEPMFPKEYVVRQIDLLLEYGIKDFEITGGEPSECKDLRFYCEYIKQKSPKSKIAVITNGGLFACDVWDLIDEVLVSYHVSKDDPNFRKDLIVQNSSYYEEIFPLGHTYNKVKKTILKARETNKLVRLNVVIAKFNIQNIRYILDDIIYDFKPDIVNFLPVNLFDEAKYSMPTYIDYNEIRWYIKYAIKTIKRDLPNTLVFVRYMPFCEMEGFEQHIVGTYQHIYDWFDWNVELGGVKLLDLLNKYPDNKDILKILGKYGETTFHAAAITRNEHYEQDKKCMFCKYSLICDGVEKVGNYTLLSGIIPSKGEFIRDINYFIGNTTYDFYKKYYGKRD